MSPVVSVCPEHGPFASQRYVMRHVEGITFAGNEDVCPRCGKTSRVIEGRFSFDGVGIATVVSAPDWSRQALLEVQADLLAIANAADAPSYSDARFATLLDKRLEKMEQRAALHDEQQRDLILELKDEIEKLRRKQPRSVFAAIVLSIWSVVGVVANVSGAVTGVGDFVEWAAGVIETAQVVTSDDLPSEVLAPGAGPDPSL